MNFTRIAADDGDANTLDTFATIGGNAQIGQTTSVGTVTVQADSTVDIDSQTVGVAIGVGAVGLNFTFVDLERNVRASMGSGADLDATGAVELRATIDHEAAGRVLTVTAGGLAVGASITEVDANGSVEAISNGTVTGGASLLIEAKAATNTADGYSEASGGGLVTANGHVATVTASPAITARLNGSTTVDGLTQVRATSLGRAKAETESKAGGLAGVGAGVATATLSPTVKASIEGGTIMAGGVLVDAKHNDNSNTSFYRAYAKTEAASIAGFGAQLNVTTANANATTHAFVDGDVNIDTVEGTSAGGVTITALGVNSARALTDGLNVGILAAIGVTRANATANGSTIAEIKDQGSASATPDYTIGNLRVEATGQDRASARANAAGGGVLSAQDNESNATASGGVRAEIGKNLGIQADGDVTVTALATPEVDADTKGVGGGGIDVRASLAYATMTPTITARIDTGTSIDATQDVTVEADAIPQSDGIPTYLIQSVETGQNTIQVVGHGLSIGDVVTISGSSREYNAISVGDTNNTLALGNAFVRTEVDGHRDEIVFSLNHNFQNGDQVVLSKIGDTPPPIPDIESAPGSTFWVRVIDAQTIKLVDSVAKTADNWFESNAGTFKPSNVSGNTITLSKSYNVNDVLTYKAPGGQDFSSSTVDVLGNSSLTTFDNDRIYFIDEVGEESFAFRNHGFANGDKVLYTTEARTPFDTPTALGGLSDGATYQVSDKTTSSLKLRAQLTDAVTYTQSGTTDRIVLESGTWFDAGFRDGQSITISGSAGNDGTFTIASVSGATLTLTGNNPLPNTSGTPATDSFLSSEVELTPDKDTDEGGPDKANETKHLLTHFGNVPIGGLVDGETYHVVWSSGNQVRLSADQGGSAISFTPPSVNDDNHLLGEFGIDLTQRTSNDAYQLRIDITGGNSGNFVGHTLLGPDGINLATIAPQSGDGTSAAVVKGSGGAVLGSIALQEAVLIDAYDVEANISAALVSADGTVTMHANGQVQGSTNGTNGNGGLIAYGEADAKINPNSEVTRSDVIIARGRRSSPPKTSCSKPIPAAIFRQTATPRLAARSVSPRLGPMSKPTTTRSSPSTTTR